MSEILKSRFEKSIGKIAKVFLNNGFKFEGTITGVDETYVEILEGKGYKIIKLEDISDVDIERGDDDGS